LSRVKYDNLKTRVYGIDAHPRKSPPLKLLYFSKLHFSLYLRYNYAVNKNAKTAYLPDILRSFSSGFKTQTGPVAVILAAGHGKRIKSHRSKMLHAVWGVPTVVRVCRTAEQGLESADQIVVVGIKAEEVARTLGARPGRLFAWQREQKGTGHAVKAGLDALSPREMDRDFYIFPGDMGLLDTLTVRSFRETFTASGAHMMVMVGIFSGNPEDNYYGRIIRVPDKDAEGNPSGAAKGRIIRIVEHKDILCLKEEVPYTVGYGGRTYSWSQRELLDIREFNTGVYAFKGRYLAELLTRVGFDNVQGEMYLTDLIYLFNQEGLTVNGAPAIHEESVLGFNDKAVLGQMQAIARAQVFEKINKIVSIADKHNFFIADEVVDNILEIDKTGASLDIWLGEGVYLGGGVKLNEGVRIEKNARLEGNIILGRGAFIGESVYLSCYPGQTMRIGNNTRILHGNIIKGNTVIGNNCLIETPVRLTGSDEYPLVIGNDVRIKGATYIFGSLIEDHVFIINCILRRKCLYARRDGNDEVIPVSFVFPRPTGTECIEDLP
jgi:bifunctional UDP-N-acetylglucosamine pyrophosphorylase/glucosamine-1-phosphate N-acetyltransferase